MIPKTKPPMAVFPMEMAASVRVLTWPASNTGTALTKNWQTEMKIEGPASDHSFFDSELNSRKRPQASLIGAISSVPREKNRPEAGALWGSSPPRSWASDSSPDRTAARGGRRGCLPFSIQHWSRERRQPTKLL